jgi:hypothetical protein
MCQCALSQKIRQQDLWASEYNRAMPGSQADNRRASQPGAQVQRVRTREPEKITLSIGDLIRARKEQSDPIFRFWAEGRWWGFPFFTPSASRYSGDKEALCLYWPLGTVVITAPKVLDFYAGVLCPPGNCLKAHGKDITDLELILNADSNAENE